jgi:hypothetical protein
MEAAPPGWSCNWDRYDAINSSHFSQSVYKKKNSKKKVHTTEKNCASLLDLAGVLLNG